MKEKDTTEQNFKRILQAIETSKSPRETESAPDASEGPGQGSTNLSLLTAGTQKAPTSGSWSVLPSAIESHTQLADHCLLVDRMLNEIGVVKYRIDYGQRDRLQKAILKVHWDEWTDLRKKHGDKPLLELLMVLKMEEMVSIGTP